jgi:allophanate hydrolase
MTARPSGAASIAFRCAAIQDLEFFGCTEGPLLFADAVEQLKALGGEAVELDLSPFLEAARLLYEGPWVAERYSVAGELMEQNPEAVLPVIRAVLAKAPAVSGVQTFRAQYRLQALKALCDKALEGLDCVLTPTIGRPSRGRSLKPNRCCATRNSVTTPTS